MSKVLNVIICVIFIFLLTFCWIYFSLKNVNAALILAGTVSCCSAFLLWQANSKWEQSKQSKQKHKKETASFIRYLQFNENNGELFSDMMKYYSFEIIKCDYDSLITEKDGKIAYVLTDFSSDGISKESARKAIVNAKRAKADKLYVFCVKCDGSTQSTANEYLPSTFIDIKNAFDLLEQCGKLPNFPEIKTKKTSIVASYALCRKRFGWYLTGSAFTLLLSAFSYLHFYLLGWSTVLFALAVYSLFNKKHNAKPTRVTLE